MSHFFAELEGELVRAARRRTAGASPRRRRLPALAGLAAVAMVFIALVGVLRPDADDSRRTVAPPVSTPRSETLVSVLNGTTRPGLAARTADVLVEAGYRRDGKVDSWRSQTVDRSRIAFLEGAEGPAFDVADILRIDVVRPARKAERRAGEGARVIVILGAEAAADDQAGGRAAGAGRRDRRRP